MKPAMSVRAPDPRREDTRQKLIAAGLELFAQYGFDGVTTRALCEKAGTNQAAIPYHFGGKEGVYLAVAQFIVDQGKLRTGPVLAAVRSRLVSPLPQALAGELLEDLLTGLVQAMLTEPVANLSFAFLSREQFQPSVAFELLYRELLEPLHQLCGHLAAALLGVPAESPAAIHAENALLGMVSSYFVQRASLNRRLAGPTPATGSDHEQSLRRLVRAMV